MGEDLRNRAFLDDAPRFHHGDSIADFLDHRHLMRDHHDREPELLIDFLEKLQNRVRGLRIQCARGFVAQKHFRVVGKGSCNCHALFLAAGKLRGIGV